MAKASKTSCYEDLRKRILSTELAPGSDLDESSLSAHYGMSRTPLREVLQQLAGEGYVRLEANRGAKISSMDLTTMRTFFQTAPMIYASTARLAAENRSKEQLDELKSVQKDFSKSTKKGDARAASIFNHRFHSVIGKMADNPYLTAALSRLLIDHTRLGQTFYSPESAAEKKLVQTASDQHDAMIAAIESREPAIVVDLTLQHWDLSRDRLERFVRPDPLPEDVTSIGSYKDAV